MNQSLAQAQKAQRIRLANTEAELQGVFRFIVWGPEGPREVEAKDEAVIQAVNPSDETKRGFVKRIERVMEYPGHAGVGVHRDYNVSGFFHIRVHRHGMATSKVMVNPSTGSVRIDSSKYDPYALLVPTLAARMWMVRNGEKGMEENIEIVAGQRELLDPREPPRGTRAPTKAELETKSSSEDPPKGPVIQPRISPLSGESELRRIEVTNGKRTMAIMLPEAEAIAMVERFSGTSPMRKATAKELLPRDRLRQVFLDDVGTTGATPEQIVEFWSDGQVTREHELFDACRARVHKTRVIADELLREHGYRVISKPMHTSVLDAVTGQPRGGNTKLYALEQLVDGGDHESS